MKPVRLFTDHLNIVKGLDKGKLWCTDAARPQAHLWRKIWFAIEDQGGMDDGLQVLHVRAWTS